MSLGKWHQAWGSHVDANVVTKSVEMGPHYYNELKDMTFIFRIHLDYILPGLKSQSKDYLVFTFLKYCLQRLAMGWEKWAVHSAL